MSIPNKCQFDIPGVCNVIASISLSEYITRNSSYIFSSVFINLGTFHDILSYKSIRDIFNLSRIKK